MLRYFSRRKRKKKDYYKILNLRKIQVTLIVKIKYHGFSFFFQMKYRTKCMESSLLSRRGTRAFISPSLSLPFSFRERGGEKKKREKKKPWRRSNQSVTKFYDRFNGTTFYTEGSWQTRLLFSCKTPRSLRIAKS